LQDAGRELSALAAQLRLKAMKYDRNIHRNSWVQGFSKAFGDLAKAGIPQ